MEKLDQKMTEFADMIRKAATDVLHDFESDVLPYVEEDTIANAMIQAEQIVKDIICGDFEWDGDYIRVKPAREFSPSVRIKFSSANYDTLRDKIIERMPECPKDAKIKSLEAQLKQAYEIRY